MKNVPKVSICMITFGHEKQIKQAIESVLMQQCAFDFQLIVSNDCSLDNTDSIIKKIQSEHPKASHLTYYSHNLNIGMMPNFIFTLQKCNGEYIALCDGDDYWTDPHKLQKQVDFLDANPEFGICFHNVLQENEFNDKSMTIPGNKKDIDLTLKDYVLNNKTATCSILFKNDIFDSGIPEWFSKVPFGDLGLILIALKKYNKKGRVLCDVMGIYRIHEKGIHGKLHENSKGLIKAYKQHIAFVDHIEKFLLFESNYQEILLKKRLVTLDKLFKLYKSNYNIIALIHNRLLKFYYKFIFLIHHSK